MPSSVYGKRIIIVEDSKLFLDKLRGLLSGMEGLEIVAIARGAAEADELMRRYRPDCLLIDMYLAEGAGLDVLRSVNTLPYRPLAIVMTSEPSEELERMCRLLGANSMIDKAQDFDRIPEILGYAA
ncbi:MAG TPA: response regulator [Bryobacteraceae bacterium]|jgi:DNA-binding NarL/FixJ family response regulator|nr:response regulator [Bryobacteraceae bacterium]